jgi:hypothetical protein
VKLRLVPIVISLVVSSVLLFGGWFLYDSFAMENPLGRIVQEQPGVKDSNVSIGNGSVTIELTPEPEANIREIYNSIVQDGSSIINNRKVELVIRDSTTGELDRWWSEALFDVAQAMETSRYAAIPEALAAKKASYPGLSVDTEMDDKYVYIHMAADGHHKYKLLPRTSNRIGVWPNE